MSRGETFRSPQQRQHVPSFPAPQQVFLEDLSLVIDVSLIVAFATALHLVRKRIITVATLAHALSVAFLVFTAGHYIERHIIGGMDEVEELVRNRGPGRASGGWLVASWFSTGLVSTAGMLALVARFWNCEGEGNCVVGYGAPIHYPCKMARLRFFTPVFAATVVFVYFCITSRLNALLGGSVLHPTGGGYALAVLANPGFMLMLCLSGCASVWLFSILIEEQARSSSEHLACGRDASRRRETAIYAGVAAAQNSSRHHGIQRQLTTTRMAAAFDNPRRDSLLQTRRVQSSQDSICGQRHDLGSYCPPDCMRDDSSGASDGVRDFGRVGGRGVSSTWKGSLRQRRYRRGTAHAVGASRAASLSNPLHPESSPVGDGTSHDSTSCLFHGFNPTLLRPFSGSDVCRGNSSGNGSEIGSMVTPSRHRQKIEGNRWASSSSSSSFSSSSQSRGRGGSQTSSVRGIHDHLRDGNIQDYDIGSSDNSDSSRGGGSTDSSGHGGDGFTTPLTAPLLPLSSSSRSTFLLPQLGHSAIKSESGKAQAAGTLEAPRSPGAPGLPLESPSFDLFPHPPAPSHSPAPSFPPAANRWSPAPRSRPVRSKPSTLASGNSTSGCGSYQSGRETSRSSEGGRRINTGGSSDVDVRGIDRFPLRPREGSGGDAMETRRRRRGRRRNREGSSGSGSSGSSSGEDEEHERRILSLAHGGGGRGMGIAAVATGPSLGSVRLEKGAPAVGEVAGDWNGGRRWDGVDGSFEYSEVRPSPPGGLLRRRQGWGT